MFGVWFIIAGAMAPCCGAGVKNAGGAPDIGNHYMSQRHQPASPEKNAVITMAYERLPLYFIANRGQVNGGVVFYETGAAHTTFFTRKEIVLGLGKREAKVDPERYGAENRQARPWQALPERGADVRTSYLRIGMLGMNKDVQVVAREEQQGKINYFKGNNPGKWRTNIPTYGAVLYKNAYPGIDIKFYGNNRRLEYDIIVGPGADPSVVRFKYSGARDVRVSQNGDLAVDLAAGSVIQQRPVVYQQAGGKRVKRRGTFMVREDRQGSHRTFTCSFDLGRYDRSAPLIVDPTFVYSTYLGGSGQYGDSASSIAIDASGNAYVTGYASSTDFPVTAGAFQATLKSSEWNVFVTKIAAGGASLVYSTYLGGSGGDSANSIAIDTSGNAYVAGYTSSTDFPVTSGAFQTSLKCSYENAFVTKIAAGGASLVYSTYLGGSGGDSANSIAVDASGNAYVAGFTFSTDFPVTSGVFQTKLKSSSGNGFVTEVAAGGSRLVYSTYLGGSGYGDSAKSIAAGASGIVYVTGDTSSTDFPVTSGAFQTTFKSAGNGYGEVFVTKLAAGGTGLVYSTYLGGSGDDSGSGIAIDASGNAYVTGNTSSTDFPVTAGAFQTGLNGRENAFVSEIAAGGASLVYSTYLGGSGSDCALGIAIDALGRVYVTGWTDSTDFPVSAGALQTSLKSTLESGFISEISAGGASLVYSTYLGGGGGDCAYGIVINSSGKTFVAGYTDSTDFPVTSGAFQTASKSSCGNGFVTEIALLVNGSCGSSNGGSFISVPAFNLCRSGAASSVTSGSGTWNWTCAGQYGGTNASCSANLKVNGACGSSGGGSFTVAPATNLCGSGTASTVSGSGPWTWSCTGLNGGTNAGCLANLKVNGACGSSGGGSFTAAPATNLCGGGTASTVSGSGPWTWSCTGLNGGTNAGCSANLIVNGACGSSGGGSFYSAPTKNLCGSGTSSPLSGSGPWTWSCTGLNGGTNAGCSANLMVNGTCGSSNGGSFTAAPATNLCGRGTASAVTGSRPWTWNCPGLNGGAGANCSANPSWPAGLWQKAVDHGGGWQWLGWFGYFNTSSFPWINHKQLGRLYTYGTSDNNIWFYNSAMRAFLWTSATLYPAIYRGSDGAWLYYKVGSSNPCWFFNLKTRKWESHQSRSMGP
ncbi:MAG: SBBP repeat-containing protein [Syntrophobacteraceae bacterium]|nr:SBBP repeat-containing protein [Syntrophobacteraceae bacterium]